MKPAASPFRNILVLSGGDFLAKTLNFLAFVFLARTLGVTNYGVLEFALSILAYFLLIVEGGLDVWATREVAKGEDTLQLVARVVPLRFLLAFGSAALLFSLLPVLPDYPGLHPILLLFAAALLVQGLNLKWFFMGQERMGRVAVGLLITQLLFSALVFGFVRQPEQVIWVPVMGLAGEAATTLYYFASFRRMTGKLWLPFTLRGIGPAVTPALTIWGTQALGLISYNFDTLLLGLLLGPNPVGWYRAAYKPITAALALPLMYYQGLFPALSRTFTQDPSEFRGIVNRSFRLSILFALPLGVGGVFLARPAIGLLYGSDYQQSVVVMQLLAWSISLVILRGTFRQALIAVGKQQLDLRSAGLAVAVNVGLNLIFIPRFGLIGAVVATVLSDLIWLALIYTFFVRQVFPVNPLPMVAQPLLAAVAMAACFYLATPVFWIIRAVLAGLIYFIVLWFSGEQEVRSWVRMVGIVN